MEALETPFFGVIDYCVFASMLTVSVGIGIVMSFRGNKTPDDFFLGNRSFSSVPVAMSLLTSFVSAISLLGFSGEVYAYGLQFSLFVFGTILAIIFCDYTTLPVLYPLRMTSVNEYIELRFKSKKLRYFVLCLCLFQGFAYLGICLYAPTIALSAVTPLDSKTYIFLLGAVCTLYSSMGGIKAVVWTDVFQFTVLMFGICVIVFIGCINLGGISNVLSIAKRGNRLNLFNMNLGFYERHTMPNVIIFGFFYYVALYGISQINVQRISSVPTLKHARRTFYLNIVGMVLIYGVIFTGGLMAYATYAGCDPISQGKLIRSEQILTFFVTDKLNYIWGLSGLFVAALVGGTLSTLSSIINAQVAMIWKDGLQQLKFFENVSPMLATVTNKITSLLVGITLIGLALWASKATSLIQLALTMAGASNGPILGVFMLGLLFPKCNIKGVWCGLATSWIFMCWITVGGFLYGSKPDPLPLSIDNCSGGELLPAALYANYSSFPDLLAEDSAVIESSFINETSFSHSVENISEASESSLMILYGISYTFYPCIGPILCIIIGLSVSLITGSECVSKVSPDLVAPYVRKFYWTEKELQVLKPEEPEGYLVVMQPKDPFLEGKLETTNLLL